MQIDKIQGLQFTLWRKPDGYRSNLDSHRKGWGRKIWAIFDRSDGNPLIPEIRNGYYRLIDRQIKMGEASGADILHRNSFNFDLGLYDADTNTLYFCWMDT